jgi:hypothetical protein
LDPQRTDRPVGVKSLPHGQAVLLRKALRPAATFGRKRNDADYHLAVPVARSSPRSLNGYLLREDFSLLHSLGNLYGNLGYRRLWPERFAKRGRETGYSLIFSLLAGNSFARSQEGRRRSATVLVLFA